MESRVSASIESKGWADSEPVVLQNLPAILQEQHEKLATRIETLLDNQSVLLEGAILRVLQNVCSDDRVYHREQTSQIDPYHREQTSQIDPDKEIPGPGGKSSSKPQNGASNWAWAAPESRSSDSSVVPQIQVAPARDSQGSVLSSDSAPATGFGFAPTTGFGFGSNSTGQSLDSNKQSLAPPTTGGYGYQPTAESVKDSFDAKTSDIMYAPAPGRKTKTAVHKIQSIEKQLTHTIKKLAHGSSDEHRNTGLRASVARHSMQSHLQGVTLTRQKLCLKVLEDTVHSNKFDLLITLLIFANLVFIAVESDWYVKFGATEDRPSIFRGVEYFFCTAFAVELMLRLIVEKKQFLSGPNKWWNAFDALIVLVSLIEVMIQASGIEHRGGTSHYRSVRVFRVTRLIRAIRLLRFFKDLRTMVRGIIASLKSLLWCLVLLLLIILVVAVTVLDLVAEELHSRVGQDSESQSDRLIQYYGSLPATLYSLFLAITGGMDWNVLADTLGQISPGLLVFFCFYVAFCIFAVFNVVTGVFVDNAAAFAHQDHEGMILEHVHHQRIILADLQEVFNSADPRKTGRLTYTQFKHIITDPQALACFKRLELDLNAVSAEGLFRLLDFDRTGDIDIEAFVMGCMNLKGQARSLQLAEVCFKLRHDNFKVMHQLKRVRESLTKSRAALATFQHPTDTEISDLRHLYSPCMTSDEQAGRSINSQSAKTGSKDSNLPSTKELEV